MGTLTYLNLVVLVLLGLDSARADEPVVMCPRALETVLRRIGTCESIQCPRTLTEKTCRDLGAVYEEGAEMCGCCSGCVKYERGYNERCSDIMGSQPEYDPSCTALVCPIIANRCKPGLVCTETDPDADGNTDFFCKPDISSDTCRNHCFVKRAYIEKEIAMYNPSVPRHLPACTPDGYFKPVQCKGTKDQGDCYCTDECGKRIYGRELYANAENTTCGCSRQVHDLRTNQGRMATLHCTENGDYEALQCDSDSALCYCVEPRTGELDGPVLPEHQWKNLPCYNETDTNNADDGRYLRVCESEWVAGQRIEREAKLHGMTFEIRTLDCDYDGGFSPLFWDASEGLEQCVHKGRTQIFGYFRAYVTDPVMDCKCARDSVYYPQHGLDFKRACDSGTDIGTPARNIPTGSYKVSYVSSGIAYCVDTDGYPFGPDVTPALSCCLTDSCNIADGVECSGVFPYKNCLEYPLGRFDDYENLHLAVLK